MSHDVIELNGKRYDAFTGEYLGKASVVPKHLGLQRKTVDGFAHPNTHRASHQPKPQPATEVKAVEPHTRTAHTIKPLKHHQTKRTQTLMRRTVHQPAHSMKPAIRVQTPAEVTVAPSSAIVPKVALSSVDPGRLKRATEIVKHHAIRRFQPQPLEFNTPVATPHHPVIDVQPAPPQITAHHQTHTAKATDIFEKAIIHAKSHEQPAPKVHRRPRRRLANSLAVAATFLVIAGFIGYLNMPGLSLRVASVQAGFGASMPNYAPTGYALDGGVKRAGGTVSLSFRSGENHFTITQQASNWNSQTLLDNTLALAGPHKTVQKNGQTIYIYDDGANAAWVNAGIRYDLSSNAQLDNQEIASIATSL